MNPLILVWLVVVSVVGVSSYKDLQAEKAEKKHDYLCKLFCDNEAVNSCVEVNFENTTEDQMLVDINYISDKLEAKGLMHTSAIMCWEKEKPKPVKKIKKPTLRDVPERD